MKNLTMYAAITGDIIGSKTFDPAKRDAVNTILLQDFQSLNNLYKLQYPFEFIRGDSFQGLIPNIEDALKVTLLIKSIFKKNLKPEPFRLAGRKSNLSEDTKKRKNWRIYNNLDIRISIGIGEIEYLKDVLSLSDGTALQYSGRELDKMKSKGQKMSIVTKNKEINRELDVELKLLNAIIDKWTPMSAEVAYYLLQGFKETETSGLLKISQSAINQRKRTANWEVIESMMDNFKYLIARI
jgi:hypothetical protein